MSDKSDTPRADAMMMASGNSLDLLEHLRRTEYFARQLERHRRRYCRREAAMSHDFIEAHFLDATAARKYLERERWGDTPICPHCRATGKHYALTAKANSKSPGRAGLWKCSACRKQFSVTVGTVFERSKIPLNVWLQAIFLLHLSGNRLTCRRISEIFDVQHKTAWLMLKRLRA